MTAGVFDDRWPVFASSLIVKQLGQHPRDNVRQQIAAEGGVANAKRAFAPDLGRNGAYTLRGKDNAWAGKLVEILQRLLLKDIAVIGKTDDRAVRVQHPGGQGGWSSGFVQAAWTGLRSSFPEATFSVHPVKGNDGAGRQPRAAVRWWLDGPHTGSCRFGASTGAEVHVMGINHADFRRSACV